MRKIKGTILKRHQFCFTRKFDVEYYAKTILSMEGAYGSEAAMLPVHCTYSSRIGELEMQCLIPEETNLCWARPCTKLMLKYIHGGTWYADPATNRSRETKSHDLFLVLFSLRSLTRSGNAVPWVSCNPFIKVTCPKRDSARSRSWFGQMLQLRLLKGISTARAFRVFREKVFLFPRRELGLILG